MPSKSHVIPLLAEPLVYAATTEACDRYVGAFRFWKELIN